jgi:hypothetical protein
LIEGLIREERKGEEFENPNLIIIIIILIDMSGKIRNLVNGKEFWGKNENRRLCARRKRLLIYLNVSIHIETSIG